MELVMNDTNAQQIVQANGMYVLGMLVLPPVSAQVVKDTGRKLFRKLQVCLLTSPAVGSSAHVHAYCLWMMFELLICAILNLFMYGVCVCVHAFAPVYKTKMNFTYGVK